ncbi:MAG: hypothetical protein GWP62_10175 [Gammaproteobacteria bacterium]|jgi:hypothetical protein|nr:hypothetical protein [Gammaproteobacteria bacterium]
MSWRSTVALLLLASNALAAEGYILGFGIEGDSADGLAVSAIGDLALTETTWLTGSIGKSKLDLPRRQTLETLFADLGLDHWFKPVGIRVGAAYWGDSDLLDSVDWRGSLYWRGDSAIISVDYEYRDFTFELPRLGDFPGRTATFDAHGIGLSGRFPVSESVSLGFYGIDYEYSVDLTTDRNQAILQLLSFSRLSLINSLVDYSAGASFGVDAGRQRWLFDLATWKGEVDGSVTNSATIRLMTPLGDKSDIEFGLGVDNSELYGTVTFLSVYLFFYGAT